MDELLGRILRLQPSFTKKNSPEMQERGKLIRDLLPAVLRNYQALLFPLMQISKADFFIEGRDGTGNKTEIPWTRIASKSLSPSATSGWYCVYLFKRDGSGVYLALSHGSTRLENGDFKPRSLAETKALVSWAKSRINAHISAIPNVHDVIDLKGSTKLSDAYKHTTVAALYYAVDSIPDEKSLIEDLKRFVSMLGVLYHAQMLGQSPEAVSPEIAAIEQIVRPNKKGGQGFGLTGMERKAVELRAMKLAIAELVSRGYETKDVSAKESFDVLAESPGRGKLYVEVKGTTGGPHSIVVTANEVKVMRENAPATALAIVHGITLDRSEASPTASGGELIFISPWYIREEALKPLSYVYQVD